VKVQKVVQKWFPPREKMEDGRWKAERKIENYGKCLKTTD